jgi:hypothetical protein
MTRNRLLLVLGLVLGLVAFGCSSEVISEPSPSTGVGGKADEWSTTDPTATVVFADDWSDAIHGTIRAGYPLAIRYDADRLPDCRGEMGGFPQWAITAHASVDGEPLTEIRLEPADDAEGTLEGTIATIPQGDDLALYFSITSTYGCHEYDSDYGNDYHFEITGGSEDGATIEFVVGDVVVEGTIEAGSTVTVLYDPARVTECVGTSGGTPAWSVTGYASVDGGRAITFDPTRPSGSERVTQPAEIEIPAGSELAIWFEINNRWGCHTWDSADGENFRFPIR